jgi:peptide chain release factor subunit 1
MAKSTSALETPLRDQLDRLAAFEPTEAPVVSLYLDMRPNEHGRDSYDAFLRKALAERARTLKGEQRKSFERDAERIREYLAANLQSSANGLAIFACSTAGLFEAVQLAAPIEHHWLFIGAVPHLYPLARVNDQYPRYAAVIVDTNAARVFVFSLGVPEVERQITNVKTRKSQQGGWSQARYQRHLSNYHRQHMKEVVDVLDRVVRDEAITHIVLAAETAAKPLLMEQMPRHLAERIIDTANMDINTPEHEVLAQTLETLRGHDADTDVERVAAMLDAWRAGGLAVVGPEDTLNALALSSVEELLITATPALLGRAATLPPNVTPGPVDVDTSAPATDLDSDRLKLADELVTRAQQQSARIRFIEDPALLADVGGVGAVLRFRAQPDEAAANG